MKKNNKKGRANSESVADIFTGLCGKISAVKEKEIETWKGLLIIALATGSAIALISAASSQVYAGPGKAVAKVNAPVAVQPSLGSEE